MMMKKAVFSHDRKYRYALWRIWDDQKPACMFIGLNPSTANEVTDDPTIRRCMSFAGSWGYGGLCMANLFAYVSTAPEFIFQQPDPVGPDNNSWLIYLAAHSGMVVACWGNWKVNGRDEKVKELSPDLYCLGTTKSGRPKHPLYLSRETKPVKFLHGVCS